MYIPQTELALWGPGGEKRFRWLCLRFVPKVPDAFPGQKCGFGVHEVQNMQQNIWSRQVSLHFCKVFQCFLLLGCSRTASPAQPAQAAQPGPASCPRRRLGMHEIYTKKPMKNQYFCARTRYMISYFEKMLSSRPPPPGTAKTPKCHFSNIISRFLILDIYYQCKRRRIYRQSVKAL